MGRPDREHPAEALEKLGRTDAEADIERAPICPHCGVTALAAETSNVIDSPFVCDNADCDAFGELVEEPG
ncbi:MAG: hypothetical protein ACR2K0_01320 [Acidimicrobiales bacterium]